MANRRFNFNTYFKKLFVGKRSNYRSYKQRKVVWAKFRILIFLYILLWLFWVDLKWREEYYTTLIDINWDMGIDFYKNWFISFTEDLLFFGTGFIGLIIGTKLPRDETFTVRISAIANGYYADKEAEFFLKNEIIRLLSYNSNFKTTITIQKKDTSGRFIYVHIDNECKIVNMCEDEKIDKLVSAKVFPGPLVDGTYGYVYNLSIKHGYRNPSNHDYSEFDEKFLLPQGHVFDLANLQNHTLDKFWNVELLEDGFMNYKFVYGMWLPIEGDLSFKDNYYRQTFTGYTQNYQLVIENKLENQNLFYELKYIDRTFASNNSNNNPTIDKKNIPYTAPINALTGVNFHGKDYYEIFFTTT